MTATVRVCIVGGGSANWGPVLLRDLAARRDLAGTIVLHDLDPGAAETMARLGAKIVAATGAAFAVEAIPDLRDALRGADFVVVTITTGGLAAMGHDLEIPLRYGIVQSVGDTVGPGGLARALRNIPVMVGIARTMEEVCPNAWLMNLTNPMTTLVRAVTKVTGIRTLGLCHEWFGVRRVLTELFAARADDLDVQIGGINHLIWLLRATVGGEDALALLRRHLDGGGVIPLKPVAADHSASFQDRWRLKLALFDAYGALPAAGDRHLAEFFSHVLTEQSGGGADYSVLPTGIEQRQTLLAGARARVAAWLDGSLPLEVERSEEDVADLIAAITVGPPWRAVVNLPNRGQIDNLPRGAVVETLGVVGPAGSDGVAVGDLPLGVLSTVLPHVVNQELIVEAALTGNRRLALQALLGDPLVRDFRSAPRLLDDLLRAHAEYLPLFSA